MPCRPATSATYVSIRDSGADELSNHVELMRIDVESVASQSRATTDGSADGGSGMVVVVGVVGDGCNSGEVGVVCMVGTVGGVGVASAGARRSRRQPS